MTLYSVWQSSRARGSGGEPIASPFKSLTAAGTEFLRGQLVLVSAGPGVGKSIFTATLALKSREPALIFSADSDAFTQQSRAVAIETEMNYRNATEMVRSGQLDSVRDRLINLPVRYVYDAAPSLDTIESHVEAYWELYGEYPALIVVDNITNVSLQDGEDRFESLEGLMDYLHTMARNTGACVIGLHHVTGPFNDADKPVPMSGIKGQLGRVPEVILTLHRLAGDGYGADMLRVSTVKNRGGVADPSGNTFVELEFDGGRMSIKDAATTSAAPF